MNRLNSIRKMIAAFSRKSKGTGFSGTLKFSLKKITGILKLEDEVDTLYYLLNHYVDITKLPPASGTLRELQLCDMVLLSIFDSICRKHNFTYWLCGGTLLGAVRHHGFIPWDDDIDVYMPRKDYDEFSEKCSEIFSEYGSDTITSCDPETFASNKGGHCIGYRPSETGVSLDMFPVDMVEPESDNEEESIKILTKKVNDYQKYYYANVKRVSYEELSSTREKIIGKNYVVVGGLTVHHPEFAFNYMIGKPYIFPQRIIFPLRTEKFEDIRLNVPNDTHAYLTGIFGDYMNFPRSGLEHHSNIIISEKSGINMNEILEKLKDIERFFRA